MREFPTCDKSAIVVADQPFALPARYPATYSVQVPTQGVVRRTVGHWRRSRRQPMSLLAPQAAMSLKDVAGSASSMRGALMSGMRGYAEMSYEDPLREGIVVAGSPDSVGEQLERLRDELGFGAMNVLMCIGDMPHHRVVTSMELFASRVMPAFR
jgi:alkanesulfonate monooxygenase SsuD/methylene tetrahydromethanopterin reductase-like flavin-dependent oxidoreductase (luciferase family)